MRAQRRNSRFRMAMPRDTYNALPTKGMRLRLYSSLAQNRTRLLTV
jgi:hypothetical protein